jgi:two-component system, NtrC family, C4-dicarboxylate transport sensor histidine kinase DctB
MNEQRENAMRIADLKDRLVQANKLSSLGQMAAGIGHEINQPLTAIGIRAQNAAALIDAGRAGEAASAIGEISALTARMGAITGELRRFARRADGRVGNVSLRAVLDGTQLLLGDRIRTTGTTLAVNATDIQVIGDQGKLEQVFVNLIQNAMDAIGDGGRIDIGADVAEGKATITIRDNGPGISADVRKRLFQPFTTSKEDGLGLGLVICRDIVAEFGGELVLVPSKSGTAFALTLKVAT